MTVRANWHLGDLDLGDDGDDPMQEVAALMASAPVIDLSRSAAEISAELAVLIERESRWAHSATCELKWGPDHILVNPHGRLTCFNCEHYVPPGQQQTMSVICALGREQHQVMEHLRAAEAVASLDAELCASRADEIEAASALAEAYATTVAVL